jgi:vacuolar-type H+-ATPase subunit E/Vma4
VAYDSFKNSVKDSSRKNPSTPDFKTLKEEAQENTSKDDSGDNTPIELPEDGLSQSKDTVTDTESHSKDKGTIGGAALEEKMDRLIEQNDRIIQILESFGN